MAEEADSDYRSVYHTKRPAFGSNILGINPDYIIEVRSDVLEEHDGPMLKHGLQELHGHRIILPKHKSDWPDKERLEWRHEEFREAG